MHVTCINFWSAAEEMANERLGAAPGHCDDDKRFMSETRIILLLIYEGIVAYVTILKFQYLDRACY